MAPNSQFGAFVMGTDRNLHEVLNEVSRNLDRATPVFAAQPKALDELQAFVSLDPLLAGLHKQYQDARQQRMQSVKEYGKGDGMTDMASILEDSAWCAMQTRYMEVRANRVLMAKAQRIMEETRIEEEQAIKAAKEREARQALEQMQLFANMHDTKEESEVGLWLALLMMYNPNQNFFRNYRPSYPFNRLAA